MEGGQEGGRKGWREEETERWMKGKAGRRDREKRHLPVIPHVEPTEAIGETRNILRCYPATK